MAHPGVARRPLRGTYAGLANGAQLSNSSGAPGDSPRLELIAQVQGSATTVTLLDKGLRLRNYWGLQHRWGF